GQVLCRVDGSAAPVGAAAQKTASHKPEAHKPEAHKPAAAQAQVGRNGEKVAAAKAATSMGRIVPAGPATRRLARKLGVALERVSGSGPRGRVTQDDLIAFSRQTGAVGSPFAAPALPDFSKWGPIEALPLEPIRKKTAEQMHLAWTQVSHVTQHDLAD